MDFFYRVSVFVASQEKQHSKAAKAKDFVPGSLGMESLEMHILEFLRNKKKKRLQQTSSLFFKFKENK
ncbi:MAG: hypothetical protein IPM82_04730 [Saprospiraceae bacterium]|nr:hypothetical protein [Saprospiraceae bacterium]